MDTKKVCQSCGTELAPDAPRGLCPACLMKVAMATGTALEGESRAFNPPAVADLAALFPQLELIEFIGRGGMGAVYKARQKPLDRVVALKILPPGIGDDPAFAERFTREAKALARLNHPNVVTLYEFGQVTASQSSTSGPRSPLYFFLMEFVDGVNLRQLLQAGRVEPREALAIVPQICDALQYAHDQGIVHRDIKPENILLDRLGRVKVADFGLAKLVGTESFGVPPSGGAGAAEADRLKPELQTALTDGGKVMGTPQYMSPEQIKAPGTVDHRADIYALGVVFYQMLTGELPGKKLEPPSRKVHIDVRLDEVVLRALEKKPELRYQQASILKTQVETIAAGAAPAENRDLKSEVKPHLSPMTIVAMSVALTYTAGLVFGTVFWAGRISHGDFWTLLVFALTAFSSPMVSSFVLRHGGPDLKRASLRAGSLLASITSLPLIGLAAFLVYALTQERGGWRPAPSEAVLVPLIWLGSLLLPVCGWGLWRAVQAASGATIAQKGGMSARPRTSSRFSRTAIVGAFWAPFILGLLPLFIGRAVPGGHLAEPSWWRIPFWTVLLSLGVTAPFGTTILGWIAVTQIRRAAGRLWGLGLGVFDGLLFPLLALDVAIGLAIGNFWASNPPQHGTWLGAYLVEHEFAVLPMIFLLCAAVDYWIIRRVWRAVNTPLPGGMSAATGATPVPASGQPRATGRSLFHVISSIVLIGILLVGLLFVGAFVASMALPALTRVSEPAPEVPTQPAFDTLGLPFPTVEIVAGWNGEKRVFPNPVAGLQGWRKTPEYGDWLGSRDIRTFVFTNSAGYRFRIDALSLSRGGGQLTEVFSALSLSRPDGTLLAAVPGGSGDWKDWVFDVYSQDGQTQTARVSIRIDDANQSCIKRVTWDPGTTHQVEWWANQHGVAWAELTAQEDGTSQWTQSVPELENSSVSGLDLPGSNTNAGSRPPLPPFVPKEAWTRAGFSTPEATLETYFWAGRETNIEQMQECMSETGAAAFAKLRKGSEQEVLEGLQSAWAVAKAYRIASKREISSSEVAVEIVVDGWDGPPDKLTLKKVDATWKLEFENFGDEGAGNMATHRSASVEPAAGWGLGSVARMAGASGLHFHPGPGTSTQDSLTVASNELDRFWIRFAPHLRRLSPPGMPPAMFDSQDPEAASGWLREQDCDAAGGVIEGQLGLKPLDLTINPVAPGFWTNGTAADARNRLQRFGNPDIRWLPALTNNPSVWLFRTRHGAEGMVQLKTVVDNEGRSGLTLKSRLIQEGEVSPGSPAPSARVQLMQPDPIRRYWRWRVFREPGTRLVYGVLDVTDPNHPRRILMSRETDPLTVKSSQDYTLRLNPEGNEWRVEIEDIWAGESGGRGATWDQVKAPSDAILSGVRAEPFGELNVERYHVFWEGDLMSSGTLRMRLRFVARLAEPEDPIGNILGPNDGVRRFDLATTSAPSVVQTSVERRVAAGPIVLLLVPLVLLGLLIPAALAGGTIWWILAGNKTGSAMERAALSLAIGGPVFAAMFGFVLSQIGVLLGIVFLPLFLACEIPAFCLGLLRRHTGLGKAAMIVAATLMVISLVSVA